MGRILEVLKQAETRRLSAKEPTPEQPDPASEEAAEEIPFIEVGPRRHVEASPSVLASPSIPPRVRESGPPEDAPVIMAPLPVWPAVSGPLTVTFRPLPARLAPELIAYHDPSSAASGQYRDLLSALLTAAGRLQSRSQAFLFTAPQAGAGTTTVLLNLAITAARQDHHRTLLIDANLERPRVAERLGLPDGPGLCGVLAGTTKLANALQETSQPDLFALAAGERETAPRLRFVAETTRSLLRQLRQQFDLVFVDGPPCEGRPDAAVLGAACDAVFLVLPEKDAETPHVDELLQTLPRQGIRLAGCILAGC
jgi:Mrp family chromosome partitioning ATPase